MISVITTVYNCENFIVDSIDSILSQTYTDYEFIIINDGSTDRTADIISRYEDKRIVFINESENRGITYRSNQAIDMASGEYIAIQDGDDISFKCRLEKEVEVLKKKESLFCVGSFAIMIDEKNRKRCYLDHPPLTTTECMKLFDVYKNPVINPSAMFRKCDFMELGKYSYNAEYRDVSDSIHDLDLWGRAFLAGKEFYNIQRALVYYRWHKDNISRKNAVVMQRSHVYTVEKMRDAIRDVIRSKEIL